MRNKYLMFLGMAIGLCGVILLFTVDWRIGLGTFLCLYGNNLERSSRDFRRIKK